MYVYNTLPAYDRAVMLQRWGRVYNSSMLSYGTTFCALHQTRSGPKPGVKHHTISLILVVWRCEASCCDDRYVRP